mmetsp:Transcript_17745/g.29760  ORF Transcript_17745/g.29760 Transcript_17745/m.29760 type:complete len:193 (-) Transcript_17745:334-912(-)
MYLSGKSLADHMMPGMRTWLRNSAAKGIMVTYRKMATSERLMQEELNVLYDSKCYLCMTEIAFLSRRNSEGKIKFTDIEDPNYDPNAPENGGVDYETGMRFMHGVRSNGEIITGVAVFREMYSLVGLGALFNFTKFPIIRPIADTAYVIWARYRTTVTRGEPLESILSRKKSADNCGVTAGKDNCSAYRSAR